ncbi:MAG: lamin tail domain-containing protein [Prevotella sp.]|nr:lamin tail domain-containing protein [Prevotella sp.]
MKRIFLLSLAFAAISASAQTNGDDGLLMGYEEPWTARLLYNPGRRFDNSWPQLCKAGADDKYTISLPYATANDREAQVQFKSTVNLSSSHKYRLTFNTRLIAGTDYSAAVLLAENSDDNDIASETYFNVGSGQVVVDNITGKDISDLKIWFDFSGNSDGTKIEISNISIVDKSFANAERWVGTMFYDQRYYAPNGVRVSDPTIEGLKESLEWATADFNDSNWGTARMPIGNAGFVSEVQTIWEGGDYNNYWIRRNFTLTKVERTSKYEVDVCHDDTYKLYVNGHLIAEAEDWTSGYETLHFEIPAMFLNEGKNVIAVYQQQNYGGKFSDLGLTVTPNYYEEYDNVNPADVLVANEIQVANIDQFIDYSFNYGAWLELYNTSDKKVNLGGLFVSDDPNDPMKFMIPMGYGVIQPHGYKTIYFDHNAADGVYGPTANKQVRFNLNDEGGTIYVSDYNGKPFITQNYPISIMRCSYARKVDGTGEWAMTGEPTPNASNNNSDFSSQRLEAPVIDTDSKLFTSPFTARVTIPAGATLRYTTDGSTPTKESAVSTDGVFNISETTPLRLRLFRKGYLPSQVITRSYIYRDKEYYLPVVAITTDNENLYGDSIGVYCQGVNGVTGHGNNTDRNNLNMDWVRPVNAEYLTADGKMVINQEAEFGIIGGWSRLYAPSSFRLKAKTIFEGQKSFDYRFFQSKPYNKYKEILIRNGGNDNDSQAHGRIKDAIIQQTLSTSGMYVDCQALQPAHVFFNGKYIGMLNLRDPSNKYFGTANYGYDKDNIDAYEYAGGYKQKAGDNKAFNEWTSLATNASSDATYQVLRDKVDVDEYANFVAAITYVGSSDWICNSNNLKGFRSRDNGRFHTTMFDVDWGFSNARGLSQLYNSNANEFTRNFKNMTANPTFRRQFIDTYCLMGGSVYTAARSKAVADSLAHLFEPALALEGKQPWSSYNELVPNMTSESRRETHMQDLRELFGLGQGMKVKLDANIPEASLRVNGLNVPLNKFDGTLFAPVDIEASAPAGYNFVGWRNNNYISKTLISRGDEWFFWDKGSLDDVDWKNLRLQGEWSNGNAPVGYGKTDIASETAANLPTYYLRKVVIINAKPTDEDVFTLNYVADDGFVLYVNGVEAGRYLMPEGTPTYNTFATTHAVGNPDTGTIILDKNLFTVGRNVIAVEVHNNKTASTDIYWDAELVSSKTTGEMVKTERVYSIDTDQSQSLTAIFEPIAEEYLKKAGVTPVVINEISAANSVFMNDYHKRNDWIELYNTTSQPVDINGMYLSDNESNPMKFQINASELIGTDPDFMSDQPTVIPPHGYLILWADNLDPMYQLHTPFKLGNNDGECVILTAKDGSWSDKIEYVSHNGEESVGRYPDGGRRVYKMTHPTISARNQLTTYAEWLYGEDTNFDPSSVDGIEAAEINHGEVIDTKYYTIDGVLLQKPVRGVNIVKLTHTDGTISTKKIIVK